jgi:MFS family permease
VAGLDADERFASTPGGGSAYVFVQGAVSAAAQLPAGLLVDRYGSRAALVASGVLLGAGQLLLAFTTTFGVALAARVLVGLGDAAVFVSVLSLVPRWFPARRVPLVTQLSTMLCQLGQVLSAVPFLALLHGAGWPVAFGTAAATSVLVAVLVLAVVRNAPAGAWRPAPPMSLAEIRGALSDVWGRPGTRLGFFGHLGTQFSMMVFTLLWGVPWLVSGQGLPAATAAALVTLFVAGTICVGPVVGVLTTRHPLRRSWILLGVIGAGVVTWTAVLARPGPAPLWLLVVLVVVLAAGGPGSVVGIDIARTSNPAHSLGIAQSMVNLGGFLATLVVLAGMGVVLTVSGGMTPDAFRLAWLLMYPVWAVAVVGVVLNRREARRLDAERGIVPRPVREVLLARVR